MDVYICIVETAEQLPFYIHLNTRVGPAAASILWPLSWILWRYAIQYRASLCKTLVLYAVQTMDDKNNWVNGIGQHCDVCVGLRACWSPAPWLLTQLTTCNDPVLI